MKNGEEEKKEKIERVGWRKKDNCKEEKEEKEKITGQIKKNSVKKRGKEERKSRVKEEREL